MNLRLFKRMERLGIGVRSAMLAKVGGLLHTEQVHILENPTTTTTTTTTTILIKSMSHLLKMTLMMLAFGVLLI